MEIISYVGASNAVKKNSAGIHTTFPHIQKKKRSASAAPFEFARPVSKTEEQFTRAGITQFFSAVVLFAVIVIVPYTVFNLLSYVENHTLAVSMNTDAEYELEALNSAMSRFAMNEGSDAVDENGNVLSEDGSVLTAATVGIGEAVTFKTYTVRAGDSISTISRKFGLSNISTLIAVNEISNVRTLHAGQKLKIPSVDGLIYKVAAGDSLNSLSVKYHVSVEEILDANDLDSDTLSKGMELFIPGAKLEATSLKKAMGELSDYRCVATHLSFWASKRSIHWRCLKSHGNRHGMPDWNTYSRGNERNRRICRMVKHLWKLRDYRSWKRLSDAVRSYVKNYREKRTTR